MSKMNKNELLIPAPLAPLFVRLVSIERIEIQSDGNQMYKMNEEELCQLFMAAGALMAKKPAQDSLFAEKMNEVKIEKTEIAENQDIRYDLDQSLLEVMESEGCNVLKAALIYQGMSLKEVAENYGGKSAAANLANFFAKANDELRSARRSTLLKILKAMNYPPAAILDYLNV